MASIMKMRRTTVTGRVPATNVARYGELSVNIPDRKIYMTGPDGVAALLADRISQFSAARAYAVDDIAIRSGGLIRAITAIAPGAYNGAQWAAVGGGGSSSGGIANQPTELNQNTIDTIGRPTVKPLVLQGDPGQTANLLEVPGTTPSDTRRAFIDPLGFPSDRFAPNIFRVSQPSHPFTARGQAVAFSGGAWVLANAANPALLAVAVVEQRLDDNNVVLRTGGRITDLQAAAFNGGVITAGTTYYVSDTVPGRLVSTPSVIRPDPVLLALGGGAGIVLVGAGSATTEYLNRVGGTMTGPLTMGGANELRFDTSATAIYKQAAVPAILMRVAGVVAARIDELGTTAGSDLTVMTRAKGDARYLRLSGGTLTGALNMGANQITISVDPTAANQMARKNYVDAQVATRLPLSGGTLTGLLTLSGAPTAALHATTKSYVDGLVSGRLTQAQGDVRYMNLTGGTFTGAVSMGSNQLGSNVNPTSDSHMARKGYVDAQVEGRLTQGQGDGRYVLRTAELLTGNGLSGGGPIGSGRTISMGTPGSITAGSENSVSTTSHTHSLSALSVLALVSRAVAGAIGTTATAATNFADGSETAFGDNVPGSRLRPASSAGRSGGTALFGTWKCLGWTRNFNGWSSTEARENETTQWLRVA